MLAKGKAKKLTVYVDESDTRHGRPIYQLVVELARKHGLAGATVTRGLMGFGASGEVHVAHPDLEQKLPVRIEIVDSAEAIDRVLPDIHDLVEEGLVELSEVEVVRYTPRRPPPPPEGEHVKLEGKAKLMRIYIGAADSWENEPLVEALVKRFHLLDLAGVTVHRGLMGYGASGRIHRRKLWRSADEPLTIEVVDTAANLEKAMPALDELVQSGMVVICDADVVFYRARPAPPPG
jgi:PII-like signaling protein